MAGDGRLERAGEPAQAFLAPETGVLDMFFGHDLYSVTMARGVNQKDNAPSAGTAENQTSIFRILPRYRRAMLVYLLAIVAPAAALLYLGLQTVERQRQAVAHLTFSNLRLSGEKLTAELERRTWELVESCLRDDGLSRVCTALGNSDTLEAAREIHALLAPVRQRHPIAQHFSILQGGTVRFPFLRSPLPQRLSMLLARENPGVRKKFEALFTEGEEQELRQQRPDLALAAYRRGSRFPISARLKALALSREARCLQKMKEPAAAAQVYSTILIQYGDVYDLFHRPYAIIAGLELMELVTQQSISPPPPLIELYNELIQGRWELSADQMDYFLARFREKVKEPTHHESEYLTHFEMAKALEDGFRHQGPLQPSQVYTCAVTRGGTSYQFFYTPIPSEGRQEPLLGFAANLNWVESQLLPQCRSELGMAGSFEIIPKTTRSAALPGNPSEVIVTFRTLFPFWGLSAKTALSKAQQTVARRQRLVFVGIIVVVLSVLGLGVSLLMRDASREMQLARLRGDFVSGVSHELKTPLTLIRLYGEMLLHGQNQSEEERRNYYQIITGESEKLTHLIEKVLDFSRIDRGLKKYHLTEGDLGPAVTRTVEVYGQYLRRQGFSVETDLAAETPPVRFDTEAVSQAVLNLMDNAARHSSPSKFIAVRLNGVNDRVILEVEDHGPGIATGEREKIFHPFYQGQNSAGKGGYGLGLFLVKHVMEAHGGEIELDTEIGRGSRFRLIFPCIKSSS